MANRNLITKLLKRLCWVCVLSLALSPQTLLAARAAGNPARLTAPQLADEPALREIVEQYFAAIVREDSQGVKRLCSEQSANIAARQKALDTFFAGHTNIEARLLGIRHVQLAGDRASLLADVEMKANDARSGRPVTNLGRLHRAFQFIKTDGRWMIWQEEAKEIEIAALLVAAKDDAQREAVLAAHAEFVTEELARTLYRQGSAFRAQVKYDEALSRHRLSLAVAERLNSTSGRAYALIGMGNVYSAQMETGQAVALYHQALPLCEALPDPYLLILLLNNLGGMYRELGEVSLALTYLRRGLELSKKEADQLSVVHVLRTLASLYNDVGNFSEAMRHYQQSYALAEKIGFAGGKELALDGIASVHLLQGNYEQAQEIFERQLKEVEVAGHPSLQLAAIARLAKLHALRGEPAQALSYSEKSLQLAEKLNNRTLTWIALNEIGLAQYVMGNYRQAATYFEQRLALSEAFQHKSETANDLINLGGVYRGLGEYEKSLQAAKRAADLARSMGAVHILSAALNTLGRAYRALKQPANAQQAFSESIAAAEELRFNVAGGEIERQRMFELLVRPYYELIGLMMEQNRPHDAFAYAERVKGRTLLDVLRSGKVEIGKAMSAEEREREQALRREINTLNLQLHRANQSAKPDAARAEALTLRLQKARLAFEAFQTTLYAAHPELRVQRGEVHAIKPAETATLLTTANRAILEYVVTDDRVYLFVMSRSSSVASIDLKTYTIPIRREELAKQTSNFRRQLATLDLAFRAPAKQLYDLLVKPAQAQLQGKTEIVIVPDGALWELPFQALLSSATRYWIEETAIAYAPSLTVLREMIAQRKQREPSTGHMTSLLALGNPAIGKETAERVTTVRRDERLNALPEAEREVRSLAELYGATQSKIYIGAEAREDRAKAEAATSRVLHFATHGVLNDASPMYSHLVLSQGSKEEDGLLEAWELMNMDLQADLVVLSACETARGRFGAGEGVIGLSWALFVAGTPTTVVSQWKVDSASTTQLMVEFHRQLRRTNSSLTKAAALRAAALQQMKAHAYRHPFYWAGFIVIGDGF